MKQIEYLKIYQELLYIYKEFLLHPKDCYNMDELYIKYLKAYVKLNKKLFTNDDISRYFQYGNCYTFALGLPCPAFFYKTYEEIEIDNMSFNVGFISHGSHLGISSEEELLDYFYADCESLGLKVYDSNITEKLKNGGFKIGMYIGEHKLHYGIHDFHFIRQMDNGMWFHKDGYNGDISEVCDIKRPGYRLVRTLEVVPPKL